MWRSHCWRLLRCREFGWCCFRSEGKVVNVHRVAAAGSVAGPAPVIISAAALVAIATTSVIVSATLVAVAAAVASISVAAIRLSAIPAIVHLVAPASQKLNVSDENVERKAGSTITTLVLSSA